MSDTTNSGPPDFNAQIIDEFRANAGKVGGMFEGVPILLLHHKGAKSGTARVAPLAYQPDGDRWVIFASMGGAPINPAWYHNLVAHPRTRIEAGGDTVEVTARVTEGDERETYWSKQKAGIPQFAEYEKTAGKRQIPVVVLERST